MSTIIPSEISRLGLSGKQRGERETLLYLQQALPDDWTVFHSVHWSCNRAAGRHGFGEIDFVVVGPEGRALLIEQKNGSLLEKDGGLIKEYSRNGRVTQKQVHDQIARSRDAVLDRYSKCGDNRKVDVGWLVYCPDYRIVNLNGLALNADQVVDSAARGDLAKRIMALAGGAPLYADGREKVLNFFMQSYNIVPDVSRYIEQQRKTYTVMCGGLVETYDNLQIANKRLRVQGVAGCGKSQLALHAYNRALLRGLRPLLVCFNRPLSDRFELLADFDGGGAGEINTFYGLCDRFLQSRGLSLDFKRIAESGFWDNVMNQVVEANFSEADKYDVLIVDEGQDFRAEWYDVLCLFMRDGYELLWLGDEQQVLQDSGAMPDVGAGAALIANVNYRSPGAIIEHLRDKMEIANHIHGNDLRGWEPEFCECGTAEQLQHKVAQIIQQELQRYKYSPDDIVVLSLKGQRSATLSHRNPGRYRLKKFERYDSQNGAQVYSDGEIRFDTIMRFKGQQAPVVIITDVDRQRIAASNYERNKLLCALTRATLKAHVIYSAGRPGV